MDYLNFLSTKVSSGSDTGFEPVFMPDFLFDFQSHLVNWAVRKGRAAVLADCGLGKTAIELVWAENIVRKTGGKVLLLTCLAVTQEIEAQSIKFNIPTNRSDDGVSYPGITVTNYEKLHLFQREDFTAVVCDESSILKNFDGRRKKEVTAFMRAMPYRLLASATPAPNDYTELGTSSECLGYMGYVDMLNKYFKNDLNNSARGRRQGEVIKWRFKGHAEEPFWGWVAGWAVAVRKPSDLGFDNSRYELPPLTLSEHTVESKIRKEGDLFALPAVGLSEQRKERRNTIGDRCNRVADIVNQRTGPSIVWCHMNDEGDLLEKLIDGAVQISGKDSDKSKESKFLNFSKGDTKVLVTKPQIGAWGLNFQHCNHMTFFPSHSYEQYYQAVRRCWRFGQTRPVHVDIVTTEGEKGVLKNLQNKEIKANDMFDRMSSLVSDAKSVSLTKFNEDMEVPPWL